MRRKISLYIADSLVDIDDQNLVLFNYTMDDMTNPTIVKNSYSQQVTLPATSANNAIFGDYFRMDRETTGTSFNALKKTPFVIYDEMDNILERGYVKLDKVTRNGDAVKSYTISLFGGLGGFFYNLMYKEDGTKKSLADLHYELNTGIIDPYTDDMAITKSIVNTAWNALANPTYHGFFEFINFAPCYNGYPSINFDANKAVYKRPTTGTKIMPNLYVQQDGYTPMQGADNTILLEMENKHTEWEMQDLRSYLQRPVISLKYLFRAFTLSYNSGDYNFVLDGEFFNEDNAWFREGWMTLPMFDRNKIDPSLFVTAQLLQGTDTPADYLIGFAKMFGLVFLYDAPSNTITLTGRNLVYNDNNVIDLSRRISRDDDVTPFLMDSQFYSFETEMFGEYPKEYKERFMQTYGGQRVNTGYEFNAETNDVLKGIVYKGGADVLETSALYQVFGGDSDSFGSFRNYLFKVPFFENVKWKLYKTDADGKVQTLTCEPLPGWVAPLRYSMDNTYRDFMTKVQLHAEDNKSENGSNVLLFFNGMVETPVYTQAGTAIEEVVFHLSDDTPAMLALNGGKPCWDVSLIGDNILDIESLPNFRRWEMYEGEMRYSWDFGDPMETATSESLELNKGLYHNFWRQYINDKFNVDTKIVRAKVDLSGYQVNGELLRKFYWFDNSIWVLNKIINHSLTTYDLTDCEFIKVQDMTNYTDGQIVF